MENTQTETTPAAPVTPAFVADQGDVLNLNLLVGIDGKAARKTDNALLMVEGQTVVMAPAPEDGEPNSFYLSSTGRVCRYTVNGKQKGAAAGAPRATTTKDKNVYRLPASILNDPLSVTEGASDEEKAAARKAKAARFLQVFGNVGITLPAEPEKTIEEPLTDEEVTAEMKRKKIPFAGAAAYLRDPANLTRKVTIPARPAGRTSLLALAQGKDFVDITPQMVTLWFQSARDLMTEHFRDAVRLVEETAEAETVEA